jgi:acyl-CoA reductase-like NAD-dependent aldehyde dehydrogenase
VISGNAKAHEDKNLEFTLIKNPDRNSELMKEEIFGPILPFHTFKTIDEAINIIQKGEKPLAIYYFGKSNGVNSKKV